MYRWKDREGNYLFKELMPFGGQLEEGNRWLKIKRLIPWGELEGEYARYFAERGRPGLDARLVMWWSNPPVGRTQGICSGMILTMNSISLT